VAVEPDTQSDTVLPHSCGCDKQRIKNMKIAKEVEDEVKALDDGNLRNRASKWVRRK